MGESLSLVIHWIPWNASDNLLCLPLSASSGNFVIATLFEKAVVRDLVDDVVVVEEAEIVSAMQLVYERMKVVVEPSGAVGVAAALSEEMAAKFPPQSFPRVGVVLCGGNADFSVVDFWANWTKRWQSF